MTVINDTRVIRLQRVAARTGHQHSADERIVEQVTDEIVTSADVVGLPPGSLITLQRGPGAAHTEEGSVLNITGNNIGGVAGGQTTSVSFDSEDAGVTAAAIFVTEIDYSLSLTSAGQYAVNYKTFQIKTYTAVPTTAGSRTLITYQWAPIREYLEWDPEDLYPDLEAFGIGPHLGSDGYDGYDEKVKISSSDTTAGYLEDKVEAGTGISLSIGGSGENETLVITNTGSTEGINLDGYAFDSTVSEHYRQHSEAIQTIMQDLDGYHPDSTGTEHYKQHSEALQIILKSLDGYGETQSVRHIRHLGSEADNSPFNSVFSLDGYEYPLDEDRLLVYINGIAQFPLVDYVELNTTTIEMSDQVDHDDIVDIVILPGSLGGGSGGTSTLQGAYDNSVSGGKSISANDGQITIVQPDPTGSALRLISSGSVTPTIIADQSGTGEAARLKSVDGTAASLLIQKDTTARNSVVNTLITERTTSHISGGLIGIGSAFLTRLENNGTTLFSASRIVTGTESATDAAEKTYLSLELSDDGILTEQARLTSGGSFGLGTSAPNATMHVQGDGYFSQGLEVAGQITAHNSPLAPLNVPILANDPITLNNGDVWITDIGGTRKINSRIGGVTYSVIIT